MKLNHRNNKIAVIGAGSWGTALAGYLAGKEYVVSLWGHRKDRIEELKKYRENRKYLPGLLFNEYISLTCDIGDAVQKASIVCMVVPSHGFREVFKNVVKNITSHACIISAVKGIENNSLMTMSQVMTQVLEENNKNHLAHLSVLSGPSFAREVADGLPTAITIGSRDKSYARELQLIFGSDILRVYTSSDIMGIEICAALKNVVAIAAGISDGLNFGLNARSAIITRGLVEISRLGLKMGADKDTFSGLSGIGDLILTCTGDLSRNRSVGINLGRGKKLKDILNEMDMVAEGIKTTESGYKLAKKHGVEMPILEQVYEILYKEKDCAKAVQDLLGRELKEE